MPLDARGTILRVSAPARTPSGRPPANGSAFDAEVLSGFGPQDHRSLGNGQAGHGCDGSVIETGPP